MSDQKICQKCWAAVDMEALACPVCGHDVLVEPDTVATTGTQVKKNDDESDTVGLSKALSAAFGFVLLLAALWWIRGIMVGPSITADDFTGRWVAKNEREFGTFYASGAPSEVSFTFWRNGPYLEHDIPFGGPTRFDARVESNVIKGGTLVGDISRPVTMTLSGDRKILTLSFTLRESSDRPDVIIHATRP